MDLDHLSLHQLNEEVTKNLIGTHFEMLNNEFIENLQVFPYLHEPNHVHKITINYNNNEMDISNNEEHYQHGKHNDMHLIYDTCNKITGQENNFNFLPENFNIKNHLSRILCYYKKEWVYNHIIIGKLIEFDIYFYIVQEVDYEHFPTYTSLLFYTNSLYELVCGCINYSVKVEILQDKSREAQEVNNELSNIFEKLST
jgi:hypothetical protein